MKDIHSALFQVISKNVITKNISNSLPNVLINILIINYALKSICLEISEKVEIKVNNVR